MTIVAIWFAISIPVSLLVGRFCAFNSSTQIGDEHDWLKHRGALKALRASLAQ